MRKYNIPIFIPHEGCGHDCVFCNQRKITGIQSSVSPDKAKEEIAQYLSTIKSEDCQIEIAYFGGSFTGLDMVLQREFLEAASGFKDERIIGIRMSTRPDYINKEILEQCVEFGVKTIELGVQSASNRVLELNRRGHVFEDVIRAAEMIKSFGIELGLQMMLGMYGSDPETDIETCRKIIELEPKCTRIYPTLVLSGTALESLYIRGEYIPYTLETAVSTAKRCLLMFRKAGVEVIRIGLYPGEDLRSEGNIVAGPFHSAFGELVENAVYKDKIEEEIIQKRLRDCDYEIIAPSSETSKIIGQKKCNKEYFFKKYGVRIKVKNRLG